MFSKTRSVIISNKVKLIKAQPQWQEEAELKENFYT